MSRNVRAVFLLCLCALSGTTFTTKVSADVYQYTDDEGHVLYSDKPIKGGKLIIQSKPTVSPAPVRGSADTSTIQNKSTAVPLAPIKSEEKKEEKAKPYSILSIQSPEDDQAFRSNNGDVQINVSMTPALQIKFGHKIKIEFDGTQLPEKWQSTTIQLQNLDRGTHTLSAIIIDKNGKQLKKSKTTTFHLQRFSRLLNR